MIHRLADFPDWESSARISYSICRGHVRDVCLACKNLEEVTVINCATMFYKEGKGGENLERRTNFGAKFTRVRSVLSNYEK